MGDLPAELRGMDVIGWIAQDMDCCVDKVVGEYSEPLKRKKLVNLLINANKVGELMNYVPRAVVCFRMGGGKEGPGPVDEVTKCLLNLKNLRVPTFYYTDDLIFGTNGWAPMKYIQSVDEVIVSSQPLETFLRTNGFTKPIHVVETHMLLPEFDGLKPEGGRLDKNKIKVIWSSSGRLGIKMLNLLVNKMNETPDKYSNVQLVLVSGGVAQVRSTLNHFRNVDKIYFDYMPKNTYYGLVKACDIAVAFGEPGDLDYFLPMEFQRPWIDSKSAVKYCMAGAAGIPIISQEGMYMYDKAIQHGKTGFKAATVDGILKHLDDLLADQNLRVEIGAAARADIVENYDIEKRAEQLVGILQRKAVARPLSTLARTVRKCWLPPVAGGPKSFHGVISKYLPKISRGRWAIVSGDERDVDAAIFPAFIGVDRMPTIKRLRPDAKLISRIDGLPMNFDGSINYMNLEVMKIAISQADIIVWQSEHCRKLWKPYVDTLPGVVIQNGVDLEVFNQAGAVHEFAGSGGENILCMNFSTFKHKRVDLVQKIISENPNMQFHIVGHYIDSNPEIEKEHWSPFANVNYLGPIMGNPSALGKLYRGATALLFTSEMEGSPNTVLEAMACGCPIIYNANSDIVPEILGDIVDGFKDTSEFKDLVYKLKDYGYRKILKRKLSKKAEEYSAEVMCHKYIKMMETTVTNGMELMTEVMVGHA